MKNISLKFISFFLKFKEKRRFKRCIVNVEVIDDFKIVIKNKAKQHCARLPIKHATDSSLSVLSLSNQRCLQSKESSDDSESNVKIISKQQQQIDSDVKSNKRRPFLKQKSRIISNTHLKRMLVHYRIIRLFEKKTSLNV